LIDKDKASIARVFVDTITYNNSLLYFYGARTIGTASEFAATVTTIQSEEQGALFINIETIGSERFLPRDTLIILEFDTYLGNNINTTLHFVNPQFSDGICEQILSLNRIDGSFSIDSVCGLDMKTGAQFNPGVRFKSIAPNPARSEIVLTFELDEETNTEIFIYDSFGEKSRISELTKYSKGEHTKRIKLNDPAPGLYFIEIQTGVHKVMKQIIVTQ
jgi:hypothetical protein